MKHSVFNIPAGLSDHAQALILATRNEQPAADEVILKRMHNVRYLLQPTPFLAYLLNRRKPPTLDDLRHARAELQSHGLSEDDRRAA